MKKLKVVPQMLLLDTLMEKYPDNIQKNYLQCVENGPITDLGYDTGCSIATVCFETKKHSPFKHGRVIKAMNANSLNLDIVCLLGMRRLKFFSIQLEEDYRGGRV